MDRSAISKVIPVVLIVVVVVVVGAVGLVLFFSPLGLPSSSPPEPEIREPAEVPIEPVPGEVPEPGGEVRPRPGQDPLEVPVDGSLGAEPLRQMGVAVAGNTIGLQG